MTMDNNYLIFSLFSNNFTGIVAGLIAGIVDGFYFIYFYQSKK